MAEKNNHEAWFTGLTNDNKIILGLVTGETSLSICFGPAEAKMIADHLYGLADSVSEFQSSGVDSASGESHSA